MNVPACMVRTVMNKKTVFYKLMSKDFGYYIRISVFMHYLKEKTRSLSSA